MTKNSIQILFFYFILNCSFAQQHVSINYIESRLITHQGVEFIGQLVDVNNDLYAFKDWNNKGILFIDDKQYSLNNLNFNISTNTFDSRVKRDQLFLYKSSEIDSININSHLFKRVGDAFYEVLFENNDDQFLKKYDVKFKAGSVSRLNGSVGKPTFSVTYKYLLKREDDISSIELTKKSILHLVSDTGNLNSFESFVKQEKLSYKKEDDTVKMIEFILQNS